MKKIKVQTSSRTEMVDITNEVQKYVSGEKIENGLILVFVPHTTAGITINEGADPSVQHDILTCLNDLVPNNARFHHNEGNSDAHIKASLIGSSISLLVMDGILKLGTWQHIFFFEGDGPRTRHFFISHISN